MPQPRTLHRLLTSALIAAYAGTARAEGDPAPAPEHVVVGPQTSYRPFATFTPRDLLIQVSFLAAGRVEGTTDFPIDRYGVLPFDSGTMVAPLLRVGALLDTRRVLKKVQLVFEYEHDLPTGTWNDGRPVEGDGMPGSDRINHQLRKGSVRLSLGPYLHLGGGFMLNQWGMGLLANDGAHGWQPGNAQFIDPRGGDRVLRGFVGTGPLTRARLAATVAFDQVRGDDVLLAGDSAYQVIAAVQAGYGQPWGGGVFFTHRRQTTADQAWLHVNVIDFAGRAEVALPRKLTLKLEGELAVVTGDTSFGATPEHPTHDVLQLGAAARVSLGSSRVGSVVDFLFASGDRNLDDGGNNGFKADPNYPMGILLFDYVQAAQTARATFTAADPSLVGYASRNLERIPTRGGVSNAITLYPRLWARPIAGLELYAGVLFAWSANDAVDPFNTRLAGGSPRNALDGAPGRYYGTEFDLGARYRMLLRGSELTLGVEGATFAPGSAFADARGGRMNDVLGGRVMLQYRF